MVQDPKEAVMDRWVLERAARASGIFGSKGPLHDGAARILEANYKPPAIQQCAQQPTQVAEGTTQHQATGLRSLMPFLGQQKVQKTTVASNTTPKSPRQNKRLSFSEDVDDEDEVTTSFSMAESTRKRFQTEKRQMYNSAVPGTSVQPETSGLAQPRTRPPEKTLGPIICGTAQARGMRSYMEDRQTFISSYTPLSFTSQPLPDEVSRTFAAVYDGHNGVMAAEYANSRLHMLLAQDPAIRWTGPAPGGAQSSVLPTERDGREAKACADVEQAIKTAFFAVDAEILTRSREEDARDGSAALMVLRVGNMLWTGHAGDSRAVLCRDGQAVRLTEDHKPELERERSRVEANGGQVDFQRCWRVICPAQNDRKASGLAMSRSLGDLSFKEPRRYIECEPDVGRLWATEEDSFIVLASDGLWDVLNDQDAVTIVKEKLAANTAKGHTKTALDARTKEAAQLLVDTALNKGSMDNVTVLVLLFQWF